ncbi:MAG: insulinase family protein [Candidatus Eremiobacteraeota bacterium]|nr:insulinase family protein [Candidatus Eremiobacteraeota bacterium]
MRAFSRGLLFFIACAFAPAPVWAIPSEVTHYGKAIVITQPDETSTLSGIELFVRAGLDRQTPHENGLAALVAECVLRTSVGKPAAPLRDAVAHLGGSLTYTVDGTDVRFYAEGLSRNVPSGVLPLLTEALRAPDFSVPTLAAARTALDRKIADNQRLPLTVGMEMLNSAFFVNSDAGLPQFGLPSTLAAQTAAGAEAFYRANYRRDGAVISAVGSLSNLPTAQLEALLDVLPAGSSVPASVSLSSLRGASRHLVAHRDINVPWLVAQFPAPSIGSRDFGPMLVLSAFLERATSEDAENPTVTTVPFADRAVGTFYNFDTQPANVVLYINGGFGDPSRPFATALSVVQIFARSKLAGDIGSLKTAAAGNYLQTATTLEDRAWLAGVFAMQSGSADYVSGALNAIERVTPADLQRVARAYLSNPTVAIVLPRDESLPPT